jgi:alcohol dehydrogenase class IV
MASPEHGLKAGLCSLLMIPSVALVDPLLTWAARPPLTASGGPGWTRGPTVWSRTSGCGPTSGPTASPAPGYGTPSDARTEMALCSLFGGMALATQARRAAPREAPRAHGVDHSNAAGVVERVTTPTARTAVTEVTTE